MIFWIIYFLTSIAISFSISGLFESQSSYKEHKYSVSDLTEFDSFAVKIVMKAANPCYVPKIQDARIVAAY